MLIMLCTSRVKLNQQLNNQESCSLALILPNFLENMYFHFPVTKYVFKTLNPHSNS